MHGLLDLAYLPSFLAVLGEQGGVGKLGSVAIEWRDERGPKRPEQEAGGPRVNGISPSPERGLHLATTPATTTLWYLGWLMIQRLYWKDPFPYQKKPSPNYGWFFIGMKQGAILHKGRDRVWSKTVLVFACTCTHPRVKSMLNSSWITRGFGRRFQVPH